VLRVGILEPNLDDLVCEAHHEREKDAPKAGSPLAFVTRDSRQGGTVASISRTIGGGLWIGMMDVSGDRRKQGGEVVHTIMYKAIKSSSASHERSDSEGYASTSSCRAE
jgi:hypothetical protein